MFVGSLPSNNLMGVGVKADTETHLYLHPEKYSGTYSEPPSQQHWTWSCVTITLNN